MATEKAPPHTSPPAEPTPPVLALRPKQAAKALGIGERLLWSLTADQASGVPHVRIGRCVVYPVDELRRWLRERSEQGDGR
ncbi:MAG: helix-turn-helix domain-containing protein [Phycisphaerales bacterium]|nr:helix-turn-helix domain-containing protein [Phycisphaerales bacterium]